MGAVALGRGSRSAYGFSCVLLFVILFTTQLLVYGQGYFGTVSGEVTDPSQAVVPGVQVTLADQRKGYQFTTTSDKSGRYLFTAIPPGVYSVSSEMQGFDKSVRTNITVNVSENATANLSLKVATARQTVDVQSESRALATEDAVTGQVVNRRYINDLPLVDRNVLEFVTLGPGINNQSDQNSVTDTGTNFVSNGSRGASADILLDGASVTNFEPNGGITQVTYTPSPEAVEEFKVQQTNFSAEYGFSGASVVNMISRSGGNAFHGSAYDFLRNQLTDANNWFNNQSGVPIPPVHRNNYGGTIGGPIIKNKTFFFFDWDGTRASNLSTHQAGVPSAAERQGNFGELCAANGGTFDSTGLCSAIAGQIYDPYSGTFQTPANGPAGAYRSAFIPFNNLATYASPGNANLNGTAFQLPVMAGNLIDPVAQKMFNLFPAPNNPSGGIYDNWIGSGASRSANDQFDIRIDHRFSDKNLINFKYSQGWNNSTPYNCFKNFTDPCGSGPNSGSAHLFALNDTYTFSPTLVLTSTLGFTRGASHIDAYNQSLNADPLGTLGFPSYLNSNGILGVPSIFIASYFSAGYSSIGQDPYGNYRQGQDTGQLSELLTKIVANHELKFGFEGRLHQQNYLQTNAPNGNFNFNSLGSSQCPVPDITQCGGDALASFLMGGASVGSGTYEIQFRPASQNFQYAGFVQDNWKVIPKLTLNLGLRYDVSLPRTERDNRMNWFDPNVVSPLNGGSISYTDPITQQPVTRALLGGEMFNSPNQRTNWVTDWKDIQPRIGFAYLAGKNTVIRGGYGIYYDQTRSGANGLLSYGSQGFNQSTNVVTTYNNDGATPYLHLSNPYPNGLIAPPGSSLGLLNDIGYGAIGPLRTAAAGRTPYEQSWSFGIQQELGSSTVLDLEYVGKKGTHLYFAGGNNLNVLGPQIESLTPNQIGNLGNYVSNPFAPLLTGSQYANSILSSPTVPAYQLLLPFPQFTSVTTDEPPSADSTYHALQISVEKRYSNGLQIMANYTWSKSIDDSSIYDTNVAFLGSYGNNSGFALQDPNNPSSERSLSTFDIPQQFKFNYTYDLPFGRGRTFLNNMPRALDLVLGGWKTAGVWTIHDGFPLQFTVANGGSPIWTYGPQRPNLTGTPTRTGGPDSNWINNYFANPQVFQIPAPYTLGNTPRTVGDVRSPFFFSSNLSLLKEFPLSTRYEALRLELRLEAENAFNHPVFGTPNTYVGDPNFGVINYTAVGPRQCQLALKFYF
ncbi:MAG TPA: carboxypeptidase regulatory-like domain-containing protein [Bryobacteraceae bacterium]|nr:carboxypeptidase regulatory-like domain-containing protein [Bryobacteraceae bacterium]